MDRNDLKLFGWGLLASVVFILIGSWISAPDVTSEIQKVYLSKKGEVLVPENRLKDAALYDMKKAKEHNFYAFVELREHREKVFPFIETLKVDTLWPLRPLSLANIMMEDCGCDGNN